MPRLPLHIIPKIVSLDAEPPIERRSPKYRDAFPLDLNLTVNSKRTLDDMRNMHRSPSVDEFIRAQNAQREDMQFPCVESDCPDSRIVFDD